MARLTVIDLITAASSQSAQQRAQAFAAFHAWIAAAPSLPLEQRLNQCEQMTLKRLFKEKGLVHAPSRPK